jgi:hypothetical protein
MVVILVATFSWFTSLNFLIQDKKYFFSFYRVYVTKHWEGEGGRGGGGGSVEN